ncbi:hypothetical protein ACU4GD_30120 [Cupriavidus basilensis]
MPFAPACWRMPATRRSPRWPRPIPPSSSRSWPRSARKAGRIRAASAAASVAGLALPLWSRDHTEVVGSLAIAGPQQRLNEESVPRMLDALREASRRLEEVVGFGR